jgi:hypothetical protein
MQPKFAFNGLRLAKNVFLDLTLGEFSAGNHEFSCLFFKNPDIRGFFGKTTDFRDLKCALIAPIGGPIPLQMTGSPWNLEKDRECWIAFFEGLKEVFGDVRGVDENKSNSSPDWQKTSFWIIPWVNLVPEITNLVPPFLKIPIYWGILAKGPVSGR